MICGGIMINKQLCKVAYSYSLSKIISADSSARQLLKLPDISDNTLLTALFLQTPLCSTGNPTMNYLFEAIEIAAKFGEAEVITQSLLCCHLIRDSKNGQTVIQISISPYEASTNSLYAAPYLFKQDNLFKLLFEQASVGVVIRDVNTEEIYQINDKYLELIGRDREEINNLRFRNITVPSDQESHDELDRDMKRGQLREYNVEKRYIKKDGAITWALVTCRAIWLPGQCPNAIIAIAQDITATKIPQLLNEFITSKSTFDSGDAFIKRLVEFVSELLHNSYVSIFKVSKPDNLIKRAHSSHKNALTEKDLDFLLAEKTYVEKVEAFSLSSECIPLQKHNPEFSSLFQWIKNDNGDAIGLILIEPRTDEVKALSKQIIQTLANTIKIELINSQYQQEMWLQAYYDALTNIPNRRYIIQELDNVSNKLKREVGKKSALLLLDLDEFKEINDSKGHALGDVLLQKVSRRLSRITRETDLIGRLGGDEFIVFLDDIESIDVAATVAEKILDSLSKKFLIQNHEFFIGCSIGIALIPDDAITTIEMLSRADQAMYSSKAAGKNCYRFYRPEMNLSLKRKHSLSDQLRVALEKDEISLLYQPLLDVKRNQFSSAEILMRWNNSELGQVSPAEFIPIAEESGILPYLSNWAFEEGCKSLKKIRKAVSSQFKLSINKSAVEFRPEVINKKYHQHYLSLLSKHQLETNAIVIELTENIFIDKSSGASEAVNELFELGFELAVDDFGTGYSSLSYLRDFPIGTLKIDRSFVDDIEESRADERLCRAIVAMCHSIGIHIVAEGVETRRQAEKLIHMGVDYLQGYFFAKPMDIEKLIDLLKSGDVHNFNLINVSDTCMNIPTDTEHQN